jgi:hypothetical protein
MSVKRKVTVPLGRELRFSSPWYLLAYAECA